MCAKMNCSANGFEAITIFGSGFAACGAGAVPQPANAATAITNSTRHQLVDFLIPNSPLLFHRDAKNSHGLLHPQLAPFQQVVGRHRQQRDRQRAGQ